MLRAIRASVMLLVLVGTARAGETIIPPAPTYPSPPKTMLQSPDEEAYYVDTAMPWVSENVAFAAFELLWALPVLL